MVKGHLWCASSVLVLISLGAAGPALAQAPATDDSAVSEVVVTGSRVVTNGFSAPTPVTVVGAEQLRNAAPSITEALRQLPQLSNSSSSVSIAGSLGAGPSTNNSANLRNLGAQRTLVLLDGRRPPVTGSTGTVDMTFFPDPLVKRVDVVTGGASAAYGSDAVSGVVNFVLDTDFEGLLVEGRLGVSGQDDAGSQVFSVSGGQKFADGRGSVIGSLSMARRDGLDGTERDYQREFWATIPNPNAGQPGQPSLLLRRNVRQGGASTGGVITTPGVLLNTAFDDNGVPYTFQHGTDRTNSVEVGGDGAAYTPALAGSTESLKGFLHAKFDITDKFRVFLEGSYGTSEVTYPNLYTANGGPVVTATGTGPYVIRVDNAYLPASIRTTMQANNIQQVFMGKLDVNFGRNYARNLSQTFNATVGLSIDLPKGFELEAYYARGEALLHYGSANNRVNATWRLAQDAVVNPANGQIVCRSTLSNPTNGCIPFNPFGNVPLSDAQRDYMTATSQARSLTVQDVVAASVSGEAFSTWAGPVRVAVGGELRKITTSVTSDEISQRLGFFSGNLLPSRGSLDVKEVFAEVLVPLAKDLPLAKSLEFNGAARLTEYSTSGEVSTWKIGLSDEVFEGFRLRSTYSQDIRAPNIGELFGGRNRTVTSVRDPANGGLTYPNITLFNGSNPALVPEEARTLTVGAVYQPEWAPSLGLSVDYYRIEITDAIAVLGAQAIVDQCQSGNTQLCTQITRDPSTTLITEIRAGQLNVSEAEVSGLDFEANYTTDLLGGSLSLRGVASYLETFRFITPGAPAVEQAGAADITNGSRPHWRANLQATWVQDAWTVALQERFIGSLNRVVGPTTVDDNSIPSTFYTNVTVRYRLGSKMFGEPELFFSVENLFDQEPRVGPTNGCGLGFCQAYDSNLYDVIGRYYTVGFRSRF